MKVKLLCAIGALLFYTPSFGQNPVPNSSFENWTNGEPDAWFTSNLPDGEGSNITRTSPGYIGEFALKGSVSPYLGSPEFPYIPLLESNTSDFGFPVTEAYPYLSLYYKFQPADTSDVVSIFVGMMDNEGTVFGGGFSEISSPSDTFRLLQVPMTYGAGQPYRAFISMTINSYGVSGLPTIGGFFVVDDISMGTGLSPTDEIANQAVGQFATYPNPATSTITIAFSLFKDSFVSVDIYDLLGNNVSDVFAGELHDGNYSLPANLGSLDSGMYMCRVTTAGSTLTQKVWVVRS
ncbi:MAG: T9SS type A sorting domain-containing protein [Saprospiraceae bacterium]|nr:T9SS type A sorting domain-containing protein [Saprospiraceae bacterium]MCF8249602.1 T9SS type A sorting domain-containing protein [Saprospiraceae bacterium]MCF8280502.1 T9SS type A sorting domain-containing protein [Bacteroidales bacterium]MCF8310434.1 T9SS type A sorting domain-containing protein [Saprospiraceae bacterium]MCF8439812.1 T9SS type A sorting domain-containing protein [Saprospiraceae bacterium]